MKQSWKLCTRQPGEHSIHIHTHTFNFGHKTFLTAAATSLCSKSFLFRQSINYRTAKRFCELYSQQQCLFSFHTQKKYFSIQIAASTTQSIYACLTTMKKIWRCFFLIWNSISHIEGNVFHWPAVQATYILLCVVNVCKMAANMLKISRF